MTSFYETDAVALANFLICNRYFLFVGLVSNRISGIIQTANACESRNGRSATAYSMATIAVTFGGYLMMQRSFSQTAVTSRAS